MPTNQDLTYQRIGEFVVLYQWLENRLREIVWLILDPDRKHWPPTALRNVSSADLFRKVEELFLESLPKCALGEDLESDFAMRLPLAPSALGESDKRVIRSCFLPSLS